MPDIQAILTVLGRRTRILRKGEEQRLDLSHTDLSRAALRGAQLQEAILYGVQLQGAALGRAQLRGADLGDAQLQGVDLRNTQLQGADLQGAQLEGAKNLTVERLSRVRTLYQAHLDPHLLKQIQQQYPHLLERPRD